MKLIRENKYENFITLGIALLVVASISIKTSILEKEEPKEETAQTQVVEFKEVERIKEDFTVPTLDEMVKEILELNIIEEDSLPYQSYKLLEFKDSEGYYRIMPVTSKVNYEVNSEGQIEDEYYDTYDAFYGIPLFKTHTFEKEDIEPYNDLFTNARIISYDDFEEIRGIAYLHGASSEFIDSVMPHCEKHNMLGNTDIAIAYTYLIPDSYRVDYEDLTNEKAVALR